MCLSARQCCRLQKAKKAKIGRTAFWVEDVPLMRQIKIDLWHNDEALDWSIEINGLRNEHVTSETLEALVECALIVAEGSLISKVTGLLQ
jgi:hypothetical protein